MDQRCLHVVKDKLPYNHISVVRQNVEGHGHGLLDFHAPTKECSTYKFALPRIEDPIFEAGGIFNLEEEVSRWARI